MSPENVGQITTGISLTMVLSLFIVLNYDSGTLKFLSKYLTQNKPSLIRSYIKLGNIILAISALVICSLLVLLLILRTKGTIIMPDYIMISIFGSLLFALIRIESGYVYAKGHLFLAQIPKSFLRHFIFFITILLILFLGYQLSTELVLFSFLVGLSVSALIQRVYRLKIYPENTVVNSNNGVDSKEIIKFCLISLLPILFLELWSDLVILIASLMVPKSDIAVLAITMRIIGIFIFTVLSVNMAVNPKLSENIHRNNTVDMYHTLDMATVLKVILAIAGVIAVYLFGPLILSVFGEEYSRESSILTIFSLSLFVYATMGPGLLFISLLELQKYLNPVFVSALLLLCISSFFLSKWFGLTGIAVSSLLVLIYWNLALTLIVYRKKQIDISLFGTLKRLFSKSTVSS